jgi:hypothetical protein
VLAATGADAAGRKHVVVKSRTAKKPVRQAASKFPSMPVSNTIAAINKTRRRNVLTKSNIKGERALAKLATVSQRAPR